jgi:hypothetical protein
MTQHHIPTSTGVLIVGAGPLLTPEPLNLLVIDDPAFAAGMVTGGPKTTGTV